MKQGKRRRPEMDQAGGKFRPHPGPLPQEREKWMARSDRAAPTARLPRGTFLASDTAGGDQRRSEGRARKKKQSDGRLAGKATPSPGGEGRGEGGILRRGWRACRKLVLARTLPPSVAGLLRRRGALPLKRNPCLIRG